MADERVLQSLVLEYLESKKGSVADPDGLDVAVQCIAEAFDLSSAARANALRGRKSGGLLDLFRNAEGSSAGSPGAVPSASPASAVPASTADTAGAVGGSVGSGGDNEAAAEAAKARGNELMAAGKPREAVAAYSEALRLAPTGRSAHIYYANRSAARLELRENAAAAEDARAAIRANASFAKAHSRLGTALAALGKTQEALRAFDDALELDPANDFARARRRELQAQIDTPLPARSAPGGGMPGGGMPGGGMPGGGMPAGLEGLLGNPMLAQMMSNPQVMAAARSMMSNPQAMQAAMSMMGGAGGAGGAGGLAAMMQGLNAGGVPGGDGGGGDELPQIMKSDD